MSSPTHARTNACMHGLRSARESARVRPCVPQELATAHTGQARTLDHRHTASLTCMRRPPG
eukprot:6179055-Pleurochrysis_carterae.AAC.2